jgi:hypothetical protein
MDADKLENQLQALKLENLALKRSLGKIEQNDKTIYCNIGDYNGHPILTFNGPGRPFSIGLKKAATLLLCTEYIREFVIQHGKQLEGYTVSKEKSNSSLDAEQI